MLLDRIRHTGVSSELLTASGEKQCWAWWIPASVSRTKAGEQRRASGRI